MFAWQTIDKHVGLRSDDSRVDETQEEESSNQRADRKVRGVRVLSLLGDIGIEKMVALVST